MVRRHDSVSIPAMHARDLMHTTSWHTTHCPPHAGVYSALAAHMHFNTCHACATLCQPYVHNLVAHHAGVYSALAAHLHFKQRGEQVRFIPLTVYKEHSVDELDLTVGGAGCCGGYWWVPLGAAGWSFYVS